MPVPATPADLIHQVREARAAADDAERRVLVLAFEWAVANPVLDGDEAWRAPWFGWDADGTLTDNTPGPETQTEDDAEWFGIPEVLWDAPAAFAAANLMPSGSGKALIRDALVLCHRLPRVWARVLAADVQAWRARRIAQTVLAAPTDVCAYVDHEVASRAQEIGSVGLDRLLDEAMLRLHPEEREAEQLAAMDARYARLDRASINHTGVAEFVIRGDWADVTAFDEGLAMLAAALKRDGCEESLDVRRSMAVGILADPERALALLRPTTSEDAGHHPKPRPKRQILLNYHLTDAAVRGCDPVGLDAEGRPHLDQVVRQWCGRDDVQVVVRPVIDLSTGIESSDPSCSEHGVRCTTYQVGDTARDEVALRHPSCVFPFCSKPARECDCDHLVPFTRGGPTCARCNLIPLCRHHHRLKTLTAWSYRTVEPGVFLWSDPHGQRFLREGRGTRDVTATAVLSSA